jgi:PII-like signaling protein
MNARRLRVYLGERDKDADGHLLHETIVHEAHQRGLAGATVFKGVAGFGANSRVHTAKILRLSEDLPLIVEIVDTPRKIKDFLPWLEGAVTEGLVTLEDVDVLIYRSSREDFETPL